MHRVGPRPRKDHLTQTYVLYHGPPFLDLDICGKTEDNADNEIKKKHATSVVEVYACSSKTRTLIVSAHPRLRECRLNPGTGRWTGTDDSKDAK
jgi:hypothetical protein